MQQHINLQAATQQIASSGENFVGLSALGLVLVIGMALLVFISSLILSFQRCTMQGWSGIGTFSVLEGCQWVLEPVSRHFLINQTTVRVLTITSCC